MSHRRCRARRFRSSAYWRASTSASVNASRAMQSSMLAIPQPFATPVTSASSGRERGGHDVGHDGWFRPRLARARTARRRSLVVRAHPSPQPHGRQALRRHRDRRRGRDDGGRDGARRAVDHRAVRGHRRRRRAHRLPRRGARQRPPHVPGAVHRDRRRPHRARGAGRHRRAPRGPGRGADRDHARRARPRRGQPVGPPLARRRRCRRWVGC